MCRSIKTPAGAAGDDDEVRAGPRVVRKVSGYRTPAVRNEVAFETAVEEIAASSRRLLETLVIR
jgi:hypothetical protein